MIRMELQKHPEWINVGVANKPHIESPQRTCHNVYKIIDNVSLNIQHF